MSVNGYVTWAECTQINWAKQQYSSSSNYGHFLEGEKEKRISMSEVLSVESSGKVWGKPSLYTFFFL